MGWRDHAIPADAGHEAPARNWRAHAIPADGVPVQDIEHPAGLERSVAKQEPSLETEGLPVEEPSLFEGLAARVPAIAKEGSFGFAPKAAAAIDGVTGDTHAGDSYAARAKHYQDAADQSAKEYPGTAIAAGLLAPMPTGKVKALGTLGNALLKGGFAGTLYGAGTSRADSLPELAEDAAKAGAVGAGVGGVLGGLGSLARKGASRFGEMSAKAVEDATAKAKAEVDKAIASAQGAYRSSVQSASRDLEVLTREAEQGAGQVADRARAFLASPEAQALREKVLGGKLGTAPERMGEMSGLKDAFQRLADSREADITAKAQEGLTGTWEKQLKPRITTLGHRIIPIALTGAGAAVGHTGAGAAAGALTALLGGRPGVVLKNAAKSPAVRKSVGDAGQAMLGALPEGVLAGKYGRALQWAAEQGPGTLFGVHELLKREFPDYDPKLVEQALKGAAPE